jgi:hypothetical protein
MSVNFIQALEDPKLLGQFIRDQSTIRVWKTLWRSFFGLPAVDGDLDLYKAHTGRQSWPADPSREAWLIIGIRGGKSMMTALLGAYLAVFRRYELSSGETGNVLIVSPTLRQSQIVRGYLSSFFQENAFLRPFVKTETRDTLELTNSVAITAISSDYRSLRGYTAVAAIVDETAFLNVEGSKPDVEVIRALRGRLMSTRGPLISISSPYARTGILYDVYKKHFAKDGSRFLVWQAPSLVMNPTLPSDLIDEARQEDPEAAKADYDASFRSDIESFISPEAVDACVAAGRYELPPIPGLVYTAFVDPSGGSGQDSFTLCICHRDGEQRVVDLIREDRPPFSPEQRIKEIAGDLEAYHITSVTGDRYAGEYPRELFRKQGIEYKLAEMPKSDLYREMLPLLNSGRVQLLDHQRMIRQLVNLERRTARGGKDSIDHPRGGHDDLINAVAGALVGAQEKKYVRLLARKIEWDGERRIR